MPSIQGATQSSANAKKGAPKKRSPFVAEDDDDDEVVAPNPAGQQYEKSEEELFAERRADFFASCKAGELDRAKELLSHSSMDVNMVDPVRI